MPIVLGPMHTHTQPNTMLPSYFFFCLWKNIQLLLGKVQLFLKTLHPHNTKLIHKHNEKMKVCGREREKAKQLSQHFLLFSYSFGRCWQGKSLSRSFIQKKSYVWRSTIFSVQGTDSSTPTTTAPPRHHHQALVYCLSPECVAIPFQTNIVTRFSSSPVLVAGVIAVLCYAMQFFIF